MPISSLSRAARGLALLLALASGVQAGSFAVSPIRATLSPDKPVSALTVRNLGKEPTVVQLELVSWSQEEGDDVYTPTREILANPPIFTISPGGSQVVRVGLRRAPDPERELAYRVYLREVLPPPGPDSQGLQVALRIGIPVFVLPPVNAAPELQWTAAPTAGGDIRLSLANSGNAHIQVTGFTLTVPGGETLATREVSAYVLPGHRREWIVPVGPALGSGTALQLAAQTDTGGVQAELILE